ncbi:MULTISPECIES: tape measure protein [unclassified Sinorhizobium]|uniref:tape measure protein n=1 Tax=unclassified Sinorhizobium TaxID=2613772 RepID=UPI003525F73C
MAATDLERLVVQLSADIKKYENSLNRALGVTNKQARAIENRFAKMSSTINSGAANAAIAAGKAFALIGGAQGLKTITDTATRIDNALRVAGLSGQELEGVYQQLFAAATKNAAPLETLVTLYGRLSLVQKELGVSQQQIVSFTSNIALALRAGGTSAQEASGALLQLSQALGGGVVRAEEFNSILEGAPTIAQAVAAGLKEAGGSVATLRNLMLDGKISSEVFFKAFEAGAPVLEQRVAGSVLTIDQRLTNLGTSLVNAAREFNESAKAGETFGNAIDQVTTFVNGVNFDNLITQIQGVIGALNGGIAAVNNFANAIGSLSGLDNVGKLLTGGAAQKSFLGGALTITSTKAIEDRINGAFEANVENVSQLTEEAIRNSVLGKGGTATTPKGVRLPAAPAATAVKPVSINDFAAPKSSSGGSGGGRKGGGRSADDYRREIEQIKERTTALQAETAAMAQVNPLINDYGFALEKARAESDLLAAAQKEGMAITPALRANIEQLATGYANASVAANRLSESQDRARQTADEFKDMSKDVASGFISDLRSGASAADALSNALNKVLDKLIDIGLNSIFEGGGGGGFLGGLFSLFGFAKGGIAANGKPIKTFAGGGVSRSAAIFGEAGPEAAVPLPDGRSIPVKFQTPAIPKRQSGGQQNVNVTVGVDVDSNGNLMPFVKSVSEQTVAQASPRIVSAANQNVVPTMAQYQATRAGGDYRNS